VIWCAAKRVEVIWWPFGSRDKGTARGSNSTNTSTGKPPHGSRNQFFNCKRRFGEVVVVVVVERGGGGGGGSSSSPGEGVFSPGELVFVEFLFPWIRRSFPWDFLEFLGIWWVDFVHFRTFAGLPTP
jgi:hypothetical protein